MAVSDDLLKSLSKKYGDKIVYLLSDKEPTPVDVIPTGSLSVDYRVGVGGIPRGRITELFGPESSGKTTLCQYIMGYGQKAGLNVAYVDTEQSFDLDYGTLCGINVEEKSFVFSQPSSLEEGLNVIEDLIDSDELGLIVLDSAVGISPEKEIKDDLADANVSLISKLLTKFCRRNIYKIRDKNIALVITNQVRDKIGAYIPTLETTGGHAMKHFASLRIQTSRIGDIKEGEDVIGVQYRAVIRKNKVAALDRPAKFSIYYGKGIWRAEDVLTNAIEYGIISLRGSYVTYEGETMAQGKVNAMRVLEENPELMGKITAELMAQLKKG